MQINNHDDVSKLFESKQSLAKAQLSIKEKAKGRDLVKMLKVMRKRDLE